MLYYKVIERKDPRAPQTPGKYYAKSLTFGTVAERELAKQIALSCTIKYPDVLSVLIAMQEEIIQCILEGYTVSLGDIGSLYATFNGVGANTEIEWDTSFLETIRVRFNPSKLTKINLGTDTDVELKKATFEKASK